MMFLFPGQPGLPLQQVPPPVCSGQGQAKAQAGKPPQLPAARETEGTAARVKGQVPALLAQFSTHLTSRQALNCRFAS